MSLKAAWRIVAPSIVIAVLAAWPALADVTVVTRYTLVSGDTLTRASYYSRDHVRVTAPDGKEFMFNRTGDTVTVISHKDKRYWTGPRALADSIAQMMIAANRKQVAEIATSDQEAWQQKVEAFNNSIQVAATGKSKKIAGYPCDEWMQSAGEWMTNQRWIARSLSVPNFGPEMQKVVLASIMDPMGRMLMRMMIDMRTKPGLMLAGQTKFKTLSQTGSFGFEAVKVTSGTIPKSAWEIPQGYTPVTL